MDCLEYANKRLQELGEEKKQPDLKFELADAFLAGMKEAIRLVSQKK